LTPVAAGWVTGTNAISHLSAGGVLVTDSSRTGFTVILNCVAICKQYIQLYSPEYTLAENINISSNIQNKDINKLINIVQ